MKKKPVSQSLSLSLEDAIDKSVSSQEPESKETDLSFETEEMLEPHLTLPLPSASPRVDNELPEVNSKINLLEQQIQNLNVQNKQLAEAIKLTSQQNTQIIQAMQNMIVADGKGDNNAQPKPNASPSQTESQAEEQPLGSTWLQIIKECRLTLEKFGYLIEVARQTGQPITNISDEDGGVGIKGIKQMLTLFKGFSDVQNDIRNWAKTQIMTDPVSQLELLSNPEFQRLLIQKIATLQPSPQPQAIRVEEEGLEGHL